MEKTMTLENISELLGKSKRTVERLAQSCDKMTQVGDKIAQAKQSKKPAEFNLEETLSIVRAGGNQILADLLAQNAKAKNNESSSIAGQDLEEVISAAFRAGMKAVQSGVIPASQIPQPQKRLPLPGSVETVKDGKKIGNSDNTLFPVPMTPREELNNLVTQKSHEWGFAREEILKRLYTEINYRKQTNVYHGRKINNCKTVLDYLERKEWIGFAIGVLKEL
jgi:hypothetical protein